MIINYYSPLPHTAVKRVTYNLENTYLALENEQGVRGGGARRLIYGRYGEGGGMGKEVVNGWAVRMGGTGGGGVSVVTGAVTGG